MINILLEDYEIDTPWVWNELKRYLLPGRRVAVVAFAFRDEQASNAQEWEALYGQTSGQYHSIIANSFASYGIKQEDIVFLNYFTDTRESAAEKIRQADIIYFLGGLPDRMMERIREFDLTHVLLEHDGVMMGYSAGALVQLAEYHLSPDEDYPEFGYYEGLPFLHDFFLEVHYVSSPEQNSAIGRVLAEKGKRVYATVRHKGLMLAEDGKIRTVGGVKVFDSRS